MAVVACAERVYQAMLKRASRLLPIGVPVCFLADRGFADTQLMRYLRSGVALALSDSRGVSAGEATRPQNLLVKSNTWIHRPHKGWFQLNQYHLAAGESVLLQGVTLTKTQPLSSINLALGRDPLSGQVWLVATDEPA